MREDTSVGTVYYKKGGAASPELQYGGWGDSYLTSLRFELSPALTKRPLKRAVRCVFTKKVPRNDPGLRLFAISQA